MIQDQHRFRPRSRARLPPTSSHSNQGNTFYSELLANQEPDIDEAWGIKDTHGLFATSMTIIRFSRSQS
jgi:hypothetical protein